MRQSYAPGRQSQASSQAASSVAQAKLLEKKKECEAVIALERASANFLKRIEDLGDDFDVIADAGKSKCRIFTDLYQEHSLKSFEVHGQVMEQWPNMFRILGLFREPLRVDSSMRLSVSPTSLRKARGVQ